VSSARATQLRRFMDRKRYMKEVYPKYWMTAREEIYGFGQYDQSLCQYLLERVSTGERILEVAIGTGYPIAEFLQGTGRRIYGVDISADLLGQCRRRVPDIACVIGDVEDLPYADGAFGCTYCFHSTWYFPNLMRAVEEMLRVTRPSGVVLFDIQNRNAKNIDAAYRKKVAATGAFGKVIRCGKNVAKIILGRGSPQWHSVVYEVPTYPETLYKHLEQIGVSSYKVMAVRADHSLEPKDERKPFTEFDRLLFVITNPVARAIAPRSF
jgi:ubiquinone/menaquinone biosynthesis C-methylase UbiE